MNPVDLLTKGVGCSIGTGFFSRPIGTFHEIISRTSPRFKYLKVRRTVVVI